MEEASFIEKGEEGDAGARAFWGLHRARSKASDLGRLAGCGICRGAAHSQGPRGALGAMHLIVLFMKRF